MRADGTNDGGIYATLRFKAEDGIELAIKTTRPPQVTTPLPTLVFAVPADATRTFAGGGSSRPHVPDGLATAAVEVRNSGSTSVGPGYLWTARRTYPLLGQTLPERQVSDLLAAISVLNNSASDSAQSLPLVPPASVAVFGKEATAPLAIYAALLNPAVQEIVLQACPTTHEDPHAPEFLGVLRVGDLPHNLALAFPRTITFVGPVPAEFEWTKQVYEKYGAADRFRQIDSISKWRPLP